MAQKRSKSTQASVSENQDLQGKELKENPEVNDKIILEFNEKRYNDYIGTFRQIKNDVDTRFLPAFRAVGIKLNATTLRWVTGGLNLFYNANDVEQEIRKSIEERHTSQFMIDAEFTAIKPMIAELRSIFSFHSPSSAYKVGPSWEGLMFPYNLISIDDDNQTIVLSDESKAELKSLSSIVVQRNDHEETERLFNEFIRWYGRFTYKMEQFGIAANMETLRETFVEDENGKLSVHATTYQWMYRMKSISGR